VLRTTMQSLGQKIIPVISSGFELSGKIIAGFVLIPSYGFLWVCLTEPIIWTVCVLFLGMLFFIRNPLDGEIHKSSDTTVSHPDL